MGSDKTKKCNLKCTTCVNYNKKIDFCEEKEIENCSKQRKIDFSQCDSYLIREELIHF